MSTPAGGAKGTTSDATDESKSNNTNTNNNTSTPRGGEGGGGGADGEAPNIKARELIRRQTVLAVTKISDRTASFRSRSNSNPMAPKGEKIMNNERALELIFEELMVCCCLHMIFTYYFIFSSYFSLVLRVDNHP